VTALAVYGALLATIMTIWAVWEILSPDPDDAAQLGRAILFLVKAVLVTIHWALITMGFVTCHAAVLLWRGLCAYVRWAFRREYVVVRVR
jgi:hypothetical protein